jgi:hypothetical protein
MRRRFLCLLACALPALATQLPAAHADQPRPYKGAFNFAITSVESLSETEVFVTGSLAGEETFLGRFEGEVQYYVDLSTGAFYGSLVKEAANGDLLYETLTGQFTATGSVGAFVMTGGTGRFLRATGGGTFVGVWTDPAMTTARVTYGGSIDFHASDRR